MTEFAVRTLVALAGGAAIVAAVLSSSTATAALLAALALVAFVESLKLVKACGRSRALPLALALFLIPAAILDPFVKLAALVTLLNLSGLRFPRMIETLYPAQVVAGCMAAAFLRGQFGPALELTAFVVTWSADTGAYLAGMTFGRTKLASEISPKKTREGAVGGLVGALIAGGIAGAMAGRLAECLVFGAVAGIAGQAGDLAESKLKRLAGVKDSGALLPGHGGALDRFDAFLVNAPLCYLAATILS